MTVKRHPLVHHPLITLPSVLLVVESRRTSHPENNFAANQYVHLENDTSHMHACKHCRKAFGGSEAGEHSAKLEYCDF